MLGIVLLVSCLPPPSYVMNVSPSSIAAGPETRVRGDMPVDVFQGPFPSDGTRDNLYLFLTTASSFRDWQPLPTPERDTVDGITIKDVVVTGPRTVELTLAFSPSLPGASYEFQVVWGVPDANTGGRGIGTLTVR